MGFLFFRPELIIFSHGKSFASFETFFLHCSAVFNFLFSFVFQLFQLCVDLCVGDDFAET